MKRIGNICGNLTADEAWDALQEPEQKIKHIWTDDLPV